MSEHITINEKGIYRTRHEYLSPLQVMNLRKRLQTRIVTLRQDIENLKLEISQKEAQIRRKEKALADLNTPIVLTYIEQWHEKRQQAEDKAKQLLKEVLGKEVYELLQQSKSLVFTANNIEYKLTARGKLFRKTNNEWRELCVVRPKYLPLPDFVASLLFNVQKKQFPFKRR